MSKMLLISITPEENEVLRLNEDVLNNVFEKIDGYAVSVVSIVGPPRLGKSLFMSYLVRLLDKITINELDPMGWENRTNPIKGFFSAGLGTEEDGIWIWSQPFIITNDEGEKTAVILLDCQGRSPNFNNYAAHLISTTVLVSSYVIFNFTAVIPDVYLSYLNVCLEYGKIFKYQTGDDESSPFQHAMFLIRDWHDTNKFIFGKNGGELFLNREIKSNAKFSECFKTNFENVSCFLLPPPGEICNSYDFQGSISELSNQFVIQLEMCIKGIIADMSSKKILQERLSANHLRKSIINYTKCFAKLSSPNVEALMEVTKDVVNDIVLQEAIQAYKLSFFQKRTRKVPYHSKETLTKVHEVACKKAVSVLNLRIGPQFEGVQELKRALQRKLEATYGEVKQINEKERTAYISNQTESITADFRRTLEETFVVFDDHFDLYDDNDILKESKIIMADLLDEFSDKFSHESEETSQELIESAEEILRVTVERLRQRNRQNHREACERMERIVENLHTNFSVDAREYFKSNPYETNQDTLRKAFAKLKSSQENAFLAKRKPGSRTFYGTYQQKLDSLMDQTYEDLSRSHEQKIRSEVLNITSFIEDKCSKLGQKFQRIMAEGGMNSSAIHVLYEMMSGEIRREFLSQNSFPRETLQFSEMERLLERSLQETWDRILELDDSKKQEVQKTFKESVAKAISVCDAEFKALSNRIGSSFLTEDVIRKECHRIKEQTFQEYNFMPKKQASAENEEKARAELESHLSKQIQVFREHNESQKKSAENSIQTFLRNFSEDYKHHIEQELETCDSVAELEGNHSQILADHRQRIHELGSAFGPHFTQKYIQRLQDRADELLVPIKKKLGEHLRFHNIEMKGILVDGQQFYHSEMGKHFNNTKFIQKDELLKFHQKAKQEAMNKCEAKTMKLTELQRRHLSTEIDSLFQKYKDKNFMNADTKDKAPAIGIDLGTTYCCVGVYKDGKVHIIPNVDQGSEKTTPSYVFIDSEENETIGKPAKDNAYQNPEFTIFDAKRIIGRRMNDPDLQSDMKFWPFTIKEDDGVPKILVQQKLYHPEEISSKLLKYFRNMAEKFLKLPAGSIKKAVITVPAYFNDGQRQATIDAGQLAELEVLNILNEPTAAAISYSMERLDSNAKNILVYDLGGGTFDVAVLAATKDGLEVLGVKGDTHLGGEDFDKNLMNFCVERFEESHGINLFDGKNSNNKVERDECHRRLRRLQTACENCKKDLTTARRIKIQVDAIVSGKDLSIFVTQAKFNELNMPLFQKTIDLIEDTLNDVNMSKQDIDDIVLVGGSSRIPMVQTMLEEFFDGKALNKSINPDYAVGYGAAVHAAKLNGLKSYGDFELPNFTDVTPMPIGVEIVTGELSVVLHKNTKIPTVRSRVYKTSSDNQRKVTISVYQGEKLEVASQNKLLGSFTLTGIPPAPQGKEPIDVSMTINSMGVLRVEAVCRSTQGRNSITVVEDKQRMSEETKQRILASNQPKTPVAKERKSRPSDMLK